MAEHPDGTLLAPTRGAGSIAYDKLIDMLLSHRLGADAPLAERRLATDLGVSRTPLREALRRLEGEGLLRRREDGTLAARRLDVEEMLEVLHVRRLLEVEATGAAAGVIPAAVLEELRAGVHALMADGNPESPKRLTLDLALHAAIGEACGNRTLADVIADLRRRTQLYATRRAPERLAPVCAEHLAILDALSAGDAGAARTAMAAHIDSTRASIVRRLLAR